MAPSQYQQSLLGHRYDVDLISHAIAARSPSRRSRPSWASTSTSSPTVCGGRSSASGDLVHWQRAAGQQQAHDARPVLAARAVKGALAGARRDTRGAAGEHQSSVIHEGVVPFAAAAVRQHGLGDLLESALGQRLAQLKFVDEHAAHVGVDCREVVVVREDEHGTSRVRANAGEAAQLVNRAREGRGGRLPPAPTVTRALATAARAQSRRRRARLL